MTDSLFSTYSKYSAARLVELAFPTEHIALLSQVGLPAWCAPNMSFGEVFELEAQLPVIETQAKTFVGLGQDRDDNIIAADLNHHIVWCLAGDSSPIFVVPNVLVLLSSLREFQLCVNAAVDIDPKCFLKARIPSEYLEPFVRWANSTDPSILQQGSFWASVLCWVGGPNYSFKPSPLRGLA